MVLKTTFRHKNTRMLYFMQFCWIFMFDEHPHFGGCFFNSKLVLGEQSSTFHRISPWIVHAWEVFDYWTGALVDRLVEP